MTSPISSITPRFSAAFNNSSFDSSLDAWVNETRGTQEYEIRQEVAKKIRTCYNQSGTSLDLSDCSGLTSLPAAIGNLSSLQTLSLWYCSRLTSLPSEIGNLSSLQELNLAACSGLTSLPPALATLSNTCIIDAEHCGLTPQAIRDFQDAIANARTANPRQGPQWNASIRETAFVATQTLEVTLEKLQSLIQTQDPNLDFSSILTMKNGLDENEKNLLNQFLIKIQNIQYFKDPETKKSALFRLYQTLLTCAQNPDFKAKTFLLINEALATCSDRIAITFNRIDLERQLLSSDFTDPKKLAAFLIGYRRLQLLHEEGEQIIQTKHLGDTIETQLFLQIHLKPSLGLPVATEGMNYRMTASVTDEEANAVGEKILNKTSTPDAQIKMLVEPLELLTTNPWSTEIEKVWEERLAKQIPEEIEKSDASFHAQFEQIQGPEGDMIARMNQIRDAQKQARKDLIKKRTEEILTAH
ncbi:MAG: NEL-type E3 ubiquitin ligase domain-containing protein [Thermodesulfobacteriota bacterium]